MKHKELKELKKLLEKEKISDKTLKKVFKLLEELSHSHKSDFKEADEFCTKLIKKNKLDKKVSKKLEEKLTKLAKALKKDKKSTKQKNKEETQKPLTLQPTRVTKTIMVQNISEKALLTKKDAGLALNSILETITESLTKGDSVTLLGFGTFSSALRAQRNGFNPASGETITIPAHKIAKFRVGSKLKEALN